MSATKLKLVMIPLLTYLFLKYCFPFLAPFICGFLLAKMISRFKGSSFIIYFFFLLFIFFIIFLIIILFYMQMKQVYFDLPAFIESLLTYMNGDHFLLQLLHEPAIALLQKIFPLLSSLLILLPKAFSFLFMTMFLTFLFLFDIHAVGRILYTLSPSLFKQAQALQNVLFETFFSMLISSFKLFLITGSLCFIGLFLINIEHALFISLLAASFDSMPLIGIGFILLPYAIYLFFIQSNKAIAVLLIYIIITGLRFFIEPKILSKQLNIPLLLHLLMMFICSQLFGWIGFFYAPVFCVLILVWYKEKQNG